jgi:hypothetical protein
MKVPNNEKSRDVVVFAVIGRTRVLRLKHTAFGPGSTTVETVNHAKGRAPSGDPARIQKHNPAICRYFLFPSMNAGNSLKKWAEVLMPL